VTLVEYGDYECPYCGRAAPVVRELLERFDGRLRFVFRHLPLTDVHPNAALAAQAAEAAGAQGRFWEMHDLLFANQEELDMSSLRGHADRLGLDVHRFEEDLREGHHAARVAQDVNTAEEAGVAGTPTFFINEVRHRGAYDLESMDTLVRRVLRLVESRARAAPADAVEE
jgi:protein-disulfide isomerase